VLARQGFEHYVQNFDTAICMHERQYHDSLSLKDQIWQRSKSVQ
jgi:hypothetical protein